MTESEKREEQLVSFVEHAHHRYGKFETCRIDLQWLSVLRNSRSLLLMKNTYEISYAFQIHVKELREFLIYYAFDF